MSVLTISYIIIIMVATYTAVSLILAKSSSARTLLALQILSLVVFLPLPKIGYVLIILSNLVAMVYGILLARKWRIPGVILTVSAFITFLFTLFSFENWPMGPLALLLPLVLVGFCVLIPHVIRHGWNKLFSPYVYVFGIALIELIEQIELWTTR